MRYLVSLGSVGLLIGCSPGHVGASTSLTQSVTVQLGAVSHSQVSFTVTGGYADPSPVTIAVRGPTVKLHTLDGRGELDAFELPLGDVMVPASAIPPKGLNLRSLVLQAGPGHAQVMHAEDEALELRADLPLTLTWSLQLDDGSLYPLGPARTEPLSLDIEVVRAGGVTTVTAQAACVGTCWMVDGVATLSDGALYLEADGDVMFAR